VSGAEAACSVHGSPAGWCNESDLSDFHELRQGFIPSEIMSVKRANTLTGTRPQAGTSALEGEIDQLVYQL